MPKFKPFLLAFAACAAMTANVADAHSKLIASSPRTGATIAAPSRLALRYDETLTAKSRVELFMTARAGKTIAPTPLGVAMALAPDRKTLFAKPKKPLAPGRYLLAWHVTAADGDRTDGTVRFAVR